GSGRVHDTLDREHGVSARPARLAGDRLPGETVRVRARCPSFARREGGFLIPSILMGLAMMMGPCARPALERDDFSSNRHPALAYWWSMIFSENRYPPRIKSGAGFFGIMLKAGSASVGSLA